MDQMWIKREAPSYPIRSYMINKFMANMKCMKVYEVYLDLFLQSKPPLTLRGSATFIFFLIFSPTNKSFKCIPYWKLNLLS